MKMLMRIDQQIRKNICDSILCSVIDQVSETLRDCEKSVIYDDVCNAMDHFYYTFNISKEIKAHR